MLEIGTGASNPLIMDTSLRTHAKQLCEQLWVFLQVCLVGGVEKHQVGWVTSHQQVAN